MNRPQCVEDMLNVSTYIMDLEMEIEKLRHLNGVAEMKVQKEVEENQRLFYVIYNEGCKWMDHHTDPAKKKYWNDFIGKLSQ